MTEQAQNRFPFHEHGEVGPLLRQLDWTASPLGLPQAWIRELTTVVNLLLESKFPSFVAWGPELGFIYNDAYAALMGNKHPAALGGRFRDIWAEIWPDIEPIIENALSGTSSFCEDLPLTVVRKGYPEPAWFTFSYSAVRDSQGVVRGMYCTVVETTRQVLERKRQDFRLRLSDSLRSSISPEDIVLHASRLLGEYLDVARVLYSEIDEAKGTYVIRRAWARPGMHAISPNEEQLDDFGPEMINALRRGEVVVIDDVARDPRTAVHAEAYINVLGIRACLCIPIVKSGKLTVVLNLHQAGTYHWRDEEIALAQEVSEQTWAAAESAYEVRKRLRVEEELRKASQRKDEFLAMLAHELRNPMAPISAAADLLKLVRNDPERVQNTGEVIARQVRHMTHLVDDLLDVSRVTRGLVQLDRAPVDIHRVINDAVEQVAPLMQAQHHLLTLRLAPEPVTVMADKERMVQVLTNLLTNAAKFTSKGGNIEVGTEVKEDQLILSVSDNGIGMAPELVDRVFDIFIQAERSSDRSLGGLGLGLALVRNIVELHGGQVTAFSRGAGKGSMFTVRLPRWNHQSQGTDAEQAAHLPPGAFRPLHVMVVDDNVDAAQMLGMLLEASGHRVTVEHGSHLALARTQTEAPEVCLLDIGLPEMDGYALARRLRQQPRMAQCMLIAVTGYSQDHDRQEALAAGFDHHLAKPIDTHALLALLESRDAARRASPGLERG